MRRVTPTSTPAAAANSGFNALAIQGDGKIVAAGAGPKGTPARTRSSSASTQREHGRIIRQGGVVYKHRCREHSLISGTVPGAAGVAVAANGDIVAAERTVNGRLSDIAAWAVTPNGATEPVSGPEGRR